MFFGRKQPEELMFGHDGMCQCGKRTYLFSRCPSRLIKEAAEDSEHAAEETAAGGLEGDSSPTAAPALGDFEMETELLAVEETLSSTKVRWITPDRPACLAGKGDGRRWIALPHEAGHL